jgi:2-polyprenyl-3-methyl-5-hydroxy-6-metoxy-1,4-benzoquinol methylase
VAKMSHQPREGRAWPADPDADRREGFIEEEIRVARFYDDYGLQEWLRLDSEARLRVIFQIHRSVLRRFLRAGERVLDAGCGPGRFSIELGRLGAQVTAGDISPVQCRWRGRAAALTRWPSTAWRNSR